MYSNHVIDFVVKKDESIANVFWKYNKHKKITIVVDENNKFVGVLTSKDFRTKLLSCSPDTPVSEIVNKNCKFIPHTDNEDLLYGMARNIFSENLNIQYVPVLKNNDIIDIFSRSKAFWLDYRRQGLLPYNHYATILLNAIQEAKQLGQKRISVIEFGVAGGNGLLACEFHAKELSRLHNIDIEVYGFDTGEGLPPQLDGYKDLQHIWRQGFYKMDVDLLKCKLRSAKLVLGNISETLSSFIEKYNPAPIAGLMVDVDYYSSTLPILNFLEAINDNNCLPRINIYFDDIIPACEFQGEPLAIKEFNQRNEFCKISPENSSVKIKLLHKFNHEKYNHNFFNDKQLPILNCGCL